MTLRTPTAPLGGGRRGTEGEGTGGRGEVGDAAAMTWKAILGHLKGRRFFGLGEGGQGSTVKGGGSVCSPVHDVVGRQGQEELVPHREDEEHEPPEEDDLAEVRDDEAQGRDALVHAVVLEEGVRVLLRVLGRGYVKREVRGGKGGYS